MESWWSGTNVIPGGTSELSRNHDAPPRSHGEETNYGPTYRVQEEDATDGTSCVPFGPCESTRQSPSSETQHGTIKMGTETAST